MSVFNFLYADTSMKLTTTDGSTDFSVLDSAGTSLMSVKSTGNVGVGTTSPSNKLDVVGTVEATGFSGSGASLTSLNANNISSGTLGVARGGTGASSLTAGVLKGNGTSAVTSMTGSANYERAGQMRAQ